MCDTFESLKDCKECISKTSKEFFVLCRRVSVILQYYQCSCELNLKWY